MSSYDRFTRTRLHLQIPDRHRDEPVISRLISEFGLVVNLTGAMVGNTDGYGYFDLELRGTPQQICQGLAYLKSLDITVIGKPNSDGDDWHY